MLLTYDAVSAAMNKWYVDVFIHVDVIKHLMTGHKGNSEF